MLQGMFPVLPTPFHDDLAIDPQGLQRVAEFAIASGADGVVFPGFASEVDELDGAERLQLLRSLTETVAGRIPIVAGASSPSVAETVARCREAESLGIRQVMIQAPRSVGATAADVTAFYAAIAREVPALEIVLQNAPAPREHVFREAHAREGLDDQQRQKQLVDAARHSAQRRDKGEDPPARRP